MKSLKDTFLEDIVCSDLHPDEVRKDSITGGCVLHQNNFVEIFPCKI